MSETSPPISKKDFNIFISYRRSDTSGYAGRLYDTLKGRFGEEHVFMDISAIDPGEDFTETVRAAISRCSVLIVIIGRNWLASGGESARRLDDANDLLRTEIVTALSRKIRVIPVLVQGATMPQPQDLPEELKSLALRNALEISDSRWDYDAKKLTGIIETLTRRPFKHRAFSPQVLKASGVVLILIIVIGLVWWFTSTRSSSLGSSTAASNNNASNVSQSNSDGGAPADSGAEADPTPQSTPYIARGIRYAPRVKDISSLRPEVARRAKQFVALAKQQGIDVIIVQTLVTFAEQDEYYAKGRTRPGPIVTGARGGQSIHNYGYAFDVVPFRDGRADWSAPSATWQQLGSIGKSLGLEWGGDFEKFVDKPHFQLQTPKTIAEQLKEYEQE